MKLIVVSYNYWLLQAYLAQGCKPAAQIFHSGNCSLGLTNGYCQQFHMSYVRKSMAYMYSSMCTSSTRTPVQRTARTDDAHRRIRVHEQQGAAALVGFPGRIIHVQHSRFGPARPDQQPGHSPSPLGYARSTVQGASTESNQAPKKKNTGPGPMAKCLVVVGRRVRGSGQTYFNLVGWLSHYWQG